MAITIWIKNEPKASATPPQPVQQGANGNGNKNLIIPVKISSPLPKKAEQPVDTMPLPRTPSASTAFNSDASLPPTKSKSLATSGWSFFPELLKADTTEASSKFDEAGWFGVPR
ncbi:hypothetical protein QFC21_003069 [Naganishia friedmannii]|uniref:Uncharacterized protein n=1 Tax=Naganishia friedmannii TaxID=89922 RepID=A0ACC2VS69_9TREE|nr:hypothetical protein QFC21_003069 [Naganishia friedmannii]